MWQNNSSKKLGRLHNSLKMDIQHPKTVIIKQSSSDIKVN